MAAEWVERSAWAIFVQLGFLVFSHIELRKKRKKGKRYSVILANERWRPQIATILCGEQNR